MTATIFIQEELINKVPFSEQNGTSDTDQMIRNPMVLLPMLSLFFEVGAIKLSFIEFVFKHGSGERSCSLTYSQPTALAITFCYVT